MTTEEAALAPWRPRRSHISRMMLVALTVAIACAVPARAFAPATVSSLAGRIGSDRLRLSGWTDSVAFIGDSLLADVRDPFAPPSPYTNDTVRLIDAQLDSYFGAGRIRVVNDAVPGLAIKYPLPSFTPRNLRDEVGERYVRDSERPDLVVIGVSAIDVNTRDEPMSVLAPILVDQLRLVVADLRAVGVDTVLVPPVPVNDEMFDLLHDTPQHLNRRVEALRSALLASDLPLLIDAHRGFDLDGDGAPEARWYVGYSDRSFDDGIHLNRDGQYVYADAVGPALVLSIDRSRR